MFLILYTASLKGINLGHSSVLDPNFLQFHQNQENILYSQTVKIKLVMLLHHQMFIYLVKTESTIHIFGLKNL